MCEFAVVLSWQHVWVTASIEIASEHAMYYYTQLPIFIYPFQKFLVLVFFFFIRFHLILSLKRISRNNKHENTSVFFFTYIFSNSKRKGGDESCVLNIFYRIFFLLLCRMTPNHNVLSMSITVNGAHIIHFESLCERSFIRSRHW